MAALCRTAFFGMDLMRKHDEPRWLRRQRVMRFPLLGTANLRLDDFGELPPLRMQRRMWPNRKMIHLNPRAAAMTSQSGSF